MHGALVEVVEGNLSDVGSLDFITEFLCGAGKELGDRRPLIRDLEVATDGAMKHWMSKGLYSVVNPVMGKGSTGIVIKMSHANPKDATQAREARQSHRKVSVSLFAIFVRCLFPAHSVLILADWRM